MTVLHVGSTQQYSDGWERLFGDKKSTKKSGQGEAGAKKSPAAKKRTAVKSTAAKKKKAVRSKAKKAGGKGRKNR